MVVERKFKIILLTVIANILEFAEKVNDTLLGCQVKIKEIDKARYGVDLTCISCRNIEYKTVLF